MAAVKRIPTFVDATHYPMFVPLLLTIVFVGNRQEHGKGSMNFSKFKPLNDDLVYNNLLLKEHS